VVGASLSQLVAFFLAAFLNVRYFIIPLESGQFDMVIAALLLSGVVLLVKGKDGRAGVLLGLAASMKCTPLLFAPYLLVRRRFRAVACFLVAVAAPNIAPDYLWPQKDGGWYWQDFVRSQLVRASEESPGIWLSDVLLNQSVAGMANRVARFGFPTHAESLKNRNEVDGGDRAWLVKLLTYSSYLVLLCGLGWMLWRNRATSSHIAGNSVERTVVESSAVICLMLLLSPMTSKAHFVILTLPVLLVAQWSVERPSWRWCLTLAGLLVTGPLAAKDLVGREWGTLALAWGLPTWHTLLLLVALWSRKGRATAPAGDVVFLGGYSRAA
jgi:hypothetical protein